MRKMALILSLLAVSTQAGLYLEGNFQVSDPKGEFGETLDRVVYGGNFGGGWFFDPVPVAIGIDLGGIGLGKSTTKHNWTSNLVTIDQTIKSSAVLGHLVLRAKLPKGPVRPYADGMFGFKGFRTVTSVINSKGDTLASSENLNDNAISYGFRGGIDIHPKKRSPIGINLATQYLWGGEADFYDANVPPIINGENYTLPVQRSKTDMLTFSIGITFDLK